MIEFINDSLFRTEFGDSVAIVGTLVWPERSDNDFEQVKDWFGYIIGPNYVKPNIVKSGPVRFLKGLYLKGSFVFVLDLESSSQWIDENGDTKKIIKW